jgi:hypothetical protein
MVKNTLPVVRVTLPPFCQCCALLTERCEPAACGIAGA